MDAEVGSRVHSEGRVGRSPGVVSRAPMVIGLVVLAACSAPGTPKATLDTEASAEHATRTGDWRAAANRWYGIFLDRDGAEVRPCVETARALIQLGDPQSASAIIDLGLEHHPEDPSLLEAKAEALVASGFRRAAEVWYERALAADPDCPTCLLGLAEQRMALGKESVAVRPLEQLVDLGVDEYRNWSMLAKARTAAEDRLGAFEAWRRAFELGDGELSERIEASMLFLDDEVRSAHPDAAQCCTAWLESVLERDPQCTRAHFQLALLCEQAGELERAEASYRRAVETDPACLMALTNLALLYSRQGETEELRKVVDMAVALETDESRKRALVRLLEAAPETQPDDR